MLVCVLALSPEELNISLVLTTEIHNCMAFDEHCEGSSVAGTFRSSG